MLRKQLNQKKVKLPNAEDVIKDKPKRMKKVELPDAEDIVEKKNRTKKKCCNWKRF